MDLKDCSGNGEQPKSELLLVACLSVHKGTLNKQTNRGLYNYCELYQVLIQGEHNSIS